MTNYNYEGESGIFVEKSRAGLVMSAIGATLAMLPLCIVFIYNVFDGGADIDFVVLALVMAALGSLLWGIGMFMTIKPMSKVGGAWSSVLGGIVLMLIFTFILILALAPDSAEDVFRGLDRINILAIFVFLGFMATHILLAICCGKIGQCARGLGLAKTGYWILAFSPVALGILGYLLGKSYYHSWYGGYSSEYETYLTLMKIVMVLIGVAVLLCVIGWWISVGSGIRIEYEYEDNTVVATVGTAPVQVPAEAPVVQEPAVAARVENQPSVIAQHQALTDEVKNSVMSMTNEQLKQIMANGSAYSPDYIEYIRIVLAKREAWEKINAFADQELMNIVTDGQQPVEVRDAASMELFSRQSPLLLNEVQKLDAEALKKVVENPDNNFDGYVAAARQLLGMN